MKPIIVTLNAIKCLAPFMASRDAIRFELFGIRIERELDHVTLIATDASVMGVLELPANSEDDFKPHALTLPGSVIPVLLRFFSECESRVQEIMISEDDGKIKVESVESNGTAFRFAKQADSYPKWRNAIPGKFEPAASFPPVNATLLAKIAESRKAVADICTSVYFTPNGDRSAIRFHYGSGTKFFGLLMPMRSESLDEVPFKP